MQTTNSYMCYILPSLMMGQYGLKRVGVSCSYYVIVTLIQLLALGLNYSNLITTTITRFLFVYFCPPYRILLLEKIIFPLAGQIASKLFQ
jgi:hypothetical protein